jgi:UDP-N-acetyl-2-amino-2-deoxyglucuronate dehydrogenase
MMKRVRFAIIGCGVIAPFHAQAIVNDERAELAAVVDIIEEKAEALAEKFNAGSIYTDYNEMLKRTDIDSVCICVPSGLHGQCVIACANAGKHVLCEKPLDIHTDVMTAMIEAVNRNHVKMGCIFQNRTIPALVEAKKLLDSGKLGKLVIAECQYRGYRSPAYYKSAGWRGTWAMDGGGCLMNQGIHAVDTLCWIAGDVESVIASTDHKLRDIEVEDTASALLQFTNGASGVLMGTTLSHAKETSPESDYFRFECENGTIIYSGGTSTLYMQDGDSYSSSLVKVTKLASEGLTEQNDTAYDPSKESKDGHSILASDLISAILNDGVPFITGDSARKGVEVVLAVYESSRQGKRIYMAAR